MDREDHCRLVSQVMLDSLASGREHRRAFRSSGTGQAAAVAYALTKFSYGGLAIYSRRASSEVWDPDLLREHAMRSPVPIRLLVDDADASGSPSSALPALADLVRDGLVLVRTPVPTDRGRHTHIAVVDGRHVRVEAEKESRGATTVFGDRDLGWTAERMFDTIWERAVPLAGKT